MIQAAALPIETSLLGFNRFLLSHGIVFRIIEESGQQVIYVRSQHEVHFVRQALADWDDEKEHYYQSMEPAAQASNRRRASSQLISQLREAPVTTSLVLGCILVALVSRLGSNPASVGFLFFPADLQRDLLSLLGALLLSPVDLVRSLTPMFLHFGELHLVFNLLWLWFFGKQLEGIHSATGYALLVIAISLATNISQFLMSGPNFGGMSGVVYGLVGYCWVVHTWLPASGLRLNRQMFIVFIIALLAMELVASNLVATAAHLGGLVAGVLLGILVVIYHQKILGVDSISRRHR